MHPASVVVLSRAALAAALLVVGAGAAIAQSAPPKPPPPVTKAPPRLPPNPSESARIPAGIDSGTSATSDALPLGTPVPPVLGADREESRTRSAAARAAARPKLGASASDCTRRVAQGPGGNTVAPAVSPRPAAAPSSGPGARARDAADC